MGTKDVDHKAALELAHHDLWWAKAHAWTVASWAVATVVAISFSDSHDWPPAAKPALSVGTTVMALAGSWYLGRMQADMAASRVRAYFHIDQSPELKASLGRWVGDPTDYNRNKGFTIALMLVVSCANAFALYVLSCSAPLALIANTAVLLIGVLMQTFQVRGSIAKAISDRDRAV
jgi:hypothetical protein